MDEQIKLNGTVVEIIFSNTDNGYTVCELESSDGDLITVTGYMPYLIEGEALSITGTWTAHPEYGDQLKVVYYETVTPSDEQSILQYLSSGVVSGIGASTAKKIVDRFGNDALNILLTEPVRLSEIKGISEKKARKMGESYLQLQSMQGIVMFLQQYHISSTMAMRIHKTLGDHAVDMIKKNPYILSEAVDGVSFKTSDQIAFTQGLPKNSPERLRAGIRYLLQDAAYGSGHTYLPKPVLMEHAAYKLGVEEEEIENSLSSLTLDKNIYFDTVDKQTVCYLTYFYTAELYIARRIISLAQYEQKYTMTAAEVELVIDNIEEENHLTLAPQQRDAVITAAESGFVILTGGPGTGKTTTIKTIIAVMQMLDLKIALAAPTGRAAKRMTEVTGLEAKTIHRLLGTLPENNGQITAFSHDEKDPLDADVIIIDEASMIDLPLMHALLRAVKTGAKVILSGDADQLPSVGPGNVLRDIISSQSAPTIRLEHIFRQAEQSLIVVNAHKINHGEMPDITDKTNDFFFLKRPTAEHTAHTVVNLCEKRLPASYGIDPLSQIQVLCPTKKGAAGVAALNIELQNHLNPPSILKQEYAHGKTIFRTGDKVMQTKNNYDMLWTKENGESGVGVYNGDMGIIEKISVKDKQLIILFDDERRAEYTFTELDQIDLAYAITVHKSQGSEFPYVVIPICTYIPALTCRNLFYTAITRAKTMVILVGSDSIIANMVQNNTERERFTGLCEKLIMMKKMTESDDWLEDFPHETI